MSAIGSFEICCVWSASSWTGSARASGIASGITSDRVTLGFNPNQMLYALQFRVHELAWHKAKKGLIPTPRWEGNGQPRRGAELADVLFEVLREQLNNDQTSYDTDRHRVGMDVETQLEKAAKEFVKTIS